MQNHAPIIWILEDDRPGNVSQIVGIANALKLPYVSKKIVYTPFVILPNFLRMSSTIGVDTAKSSKLDDQKPDIVIAAGRRTAPILKYIKKNNPSCLIIQLMWPSTSANGFDLIVLPKHDTKKNLPNIITTIGAPNKITPALLQERLTTAEQRFNNFSRPRVAMLVGGTTKAGVFTNAMANELGALADDIAKQNKASLLISSSRRTSLEATNTLKFCITVPHHFYSWYDGGENPYLDYLAIADYLIVTGDSISMCSEATSTGKPVFIYSPASITPKKHQQFHLQLYELGYAAPLRADTDLQSLAQTKPPLNESLVVAQKIMNLYLRQG